MKKTLRFAITINAPREKVWETIIGPDSYREWTAPFMEGSTFEGSWNTGDRIRFLAPDGSGMSAVIEASRRPEFISIKHLGEVHEGVEDHDSEKVRQWAPLYENYSLNDVAGATEYVVDLDVIPEFEQMMRDMWPLALEKVKAISERG